MKKLLLTAALVALFASPAIAQGNRDRDNGPRGQRNATPAAQPAPQRPAMGRNDQNRNPPGNMTGPRNTMRRDAGSPQPPAAMNRPPAPGMAGPRPGARPDFRTYNRNFTAPQRFRAPVYRRPPGFYDHRWTFGERLPTIFWMRDYWLTNFFAYGLPPPPPGTVWVRYGNDALLIDQYNGEIIQVRYGVFY